MTTERKTPPTPKLSIRASFARLAATCRAQHDIRYYLGGIYVEPRKAGGAIIVGTNGHHMIAIIDPEATCEAPTIIKPGRGLIQACPKIDAKGDSSACVLRTVEFEDHAALLLTDELGLAKRIQPRDVIIEAKFPDWRRVMPDFEKLRRGSIGTFDASLMHAPITAFANHQHVLVENFQEHDAPGQKAVRRLSFRNDIIHIVMAARGEDKVGAFSQTWQAEKDAR